MPIPAPQHRKHAVASVACAVITVSDTRTLDTDTSGGCIRSLLGSAGHQVGCYEIVKDEADTIRNLVLRLVEACEVQAILLNGGTGLSPRDNTYEAVEKLLEKKLDGFGELFRMLSFDEIGPAAMLSRAVAGVRGRCVIFSMPGSTKAVELAMSKLIVPELGHLVWLVGS